MSFTASSPIYLSEFQHVVDRPRNPNDPSVVTWEDYNIDPETTYEYYLDAYDTSSFKNRSTKSVIATIFSGDTDAPLSPSGCGTAGAWRCRGSRLR